MGAKMGKAIVIIVMLLAAFAATAVAGTGYNYLPPAEFKQWLEGGKKMQIVDIQVPAEFQQQHFRGSIETNAYPVKSAEEKQRLDKALPVLAASSEEIVVVCPRGGGGAKSACDYLFGKGIAAGRLYILEDGMKGWPYKELTVTAGK